MLEVVPLWVTMRQGLHSLKNWFFVLLQDFTSYEITQLAPLQLKEIGAESKACLYNGSTYVDETFAQILKPYLTSHYPKTRVSEKHIERATRHFSDARKPGFSRALKTRGPFPFEVGSPEDYLDGEIDVPWYVPTGLIKSPRYPAHLWMSTIKGSARSGVQTTCGFDR
jgi:hypothetical protein